MFGTFPPVCCRIVCVRIDLQQMVDDIEVQIIIIDVRRRLTRVSKAVDKALEGKPEESHGCRLNENNSNSQEMPRGGEVISMKAGVMSLPVSLDITPL